MRCVSQVLLRDLRYYPDPVGVRPPLNTHAVPQCNALNSIQPGPTSADLSNTVPRGDRPPRLRAAQECQRACPEFEQPLGRMTIRNCRRLQPVRCFRLRDMDHVLGYVGSIHRDDHIGEAVCGNVSPHLWYD